MTDIPKKIAGRYHIKELLGKGGFGAVYRAEDELEDREVALKVIRSDGAADPRGTRSRSLDGSSSQSSSRSRFGRYSRAGSRTNRKNFTSNPSPAPSDDVTERFKDEFLLLTRLHHPNLATVYEFGRCDEIDGVYFTQELVEGVYLSEFLEAKSRELIVDVFVQLARALDYIHALGMVHEDIKPTNVLVTNHHGQAQAKLIDFGLARVLRNGPDGEGGEEEGSDDVHGTPGFSAPEKIRGEKTDSRSDIYSLAATMYAAIRGSKPFPSRDFEEALRAQKDWRPELAGALLKQAGPVVAELIGRMLNPDPERRPQSARSIVLELLRREPSHIRDRQDNQEDRAEFARVFVEHLPFADRQSYLDLLLTRATDVLLPELSAESSRTQGKNRLIRAVIIEAPEGMGKSRLLGELRREIQIGGGLFVESSCWTTERTALGAFGPVVLQLATALGERSKVIADYAELLQLARDRGTDESAAGRLMEFLIAACRERPYCLHLSELSKGLSEFVRFEQLARAIDHNSAPLLLCGSSIPHTKLGPLLATLARDQLAENWSLRPFTRREMHSVLQGVLGETPAIRELVKALDNLTGGHPLSFRETLRVLIEEGILARDADDWVFRSNSPAAQNLHQTLAQRSEARLDAQGVSAWEIASILYLIEAPIEETQLAQLSDLRKSRFRRAIDRLEGEGLIVRSTTSATSHITLAHESVREAVRRRYADSLDETRLDLATRIDDLEVIDSNFVFLKVRLLDDAAEGLEAVDALEEAAAGLFAVGQAQLGASVLERLIRRLRMHGGTAAIPRLLEAKLLLLNQGSGALDDPRREIAHYEAGILLSELMRDFRAQSLFWLGLADRATAEVDDDMELTLYRLSRAASAAQRARDRVLELRISNRRAEVLLSAGEIEQAGSYSRKAMEILDLDDANDVDVCHIIGVRLRCLSLSGQLGEARRLHEMGKPVAARVPVVQRQSYLSGIAFLAVLGGDPDRAIPETLQAIEQVRAARVPRLLHTPLHNLGDLYLRAGQLEPAAAAFNEAIDIAALFGLDHAVHLNRGFLGYTLARLGKVEEGAVQLATARRRMQQSSGDQVTLQQLRLLDAEVAHIMGQTPRARRELEEMLADFHSTNEISFVHWAQDALARIERDIGTNFIESTNIPEPATAPDEDTVRTRPIG
ncbi:serine/threonine protein kinase with Chase2 sensor [Enhygromyxa salina]|uniref:Serine/threonine protein kinase with Chase2 sensor n=1 Tax=Enhygromyxa salina TaxID=215803 RepID=A0A0C1Z3Q0_9BACT|nr:serine/threonine-protein kinase [Enhygromyxa salina]KIG12224.1 serine/threonine protein kinase with Chase2 sensor [Enhygromyxa salina]